MGKVVLVDLDSTIVDTETSWLRELNKLYDKNVTVSDIVTWDTIADIFGKKEAKGLLFSEGFYPNHVRPIEGSYEFLVKLNELGYDVKLLTASPKNEEKLEYLTKYFPDVFSEYIFEKDKLKVKGDVIIDDAPHNIIPHVREHNSLGFLFNHEGRYRYNDVLWNNPKFFRVKSYQKILEVLGG